MSLPEADEPGWVAVARLGKTRGKRGELTALALSGKPERYQALREVYLFRESAADGERLGVEFLRIVHMNRSR